MAGKKGDVVDLTEEDEESTGSKKGKKPPKAPKTPKDKKAAPAAKEKAEGGKKGGKGRVIFILVIIIIVGGFIFEETQFNYLGMRTKFVEAVAKLEPEYKTYEEKYAELEREAAELEKRVKALDATQTQLSNLQAELELRELEIAEREKNLTPIYLQPLSGQELEDMQSLSRTYSQMDPADAANILESLYSQQDIAAIMYHMAERSRASVFAAMDVDLAAAITEILLYK